MCWGRVGSESAMSKANRSKDLPPLDVSSYTLKVKVDLENLKRRLPLYRQGFIKVR